MAFCRHYAKLSPGAEHSRRKWHLRNLASICHLLPVLPLVFAAKAIVHIMMAKYFCHAIYQTQIYHGSRGCYLFCQIVVYSSAWNSRQEGSWANFLNLPLQALYFNIWSHSLFIWKPQSGAGEGGRGSQNLRWPPPIFWNNENKCVFN